MSENLDGGHDSYNSYIRRSHRMDLPSILNIQDVPLYGRSASSTDSTPSPRTPQSGSPQKPIHSPYHNGFYSKPGANSAAIMRVNAGVGESPWGVSAFASSVNAAPAFRPPDRRRYKCSYTDFLDITSKSSLRIDIHKPRPSAERSGVSGVIAYDHFGPSAPPDALESTGLPSPLPSDSTLRTYLSSSASSSR